MASSNLRDDLVDSLEAQVESLRKEVSGLRKTLTKRGKAAYADASESAGSIYEELIERWADVAPRARKHARRVESVARENPAATAAAGLIVVGLLAALVLRR